MLKPTLCLLAAVSLPLAACAHDTWVQTNTNLVRVGDAVHVDLMLGNHGNTHRDFKLAGKLKLEGASLQVTDPKGKRYDLKPSLADLGYAPNEGFWSGRFAAAEPGLYLVSHTYNAVVSYAPKRAVKSAKAFFVASRSLDRVSENNPGFDRVLGHALELVPEANPVTPMGPGQALKLKVLFQGKPLPGARVAFVPRGETLSEGADARYERTSDPVGRVSFTPKEGNYYLAVVHHKTDEKGEGFDATEYSATLTVYVPQVCPCCGE